MRKILKKIYIQGAMDALDSRKIGKGKELCQEVVAQAEQEILARVPKKKADNYFEGKLKDMKLYPWTKEKIEGYNQAIDDIIKRLGE